MAPRSRPGSALALVLFALVAEVAPGCLPRPAVRPGPAPAAAAVEAWLARRDEALPALALRAIVTSSGAPGRRWPLRVEAQGDRVRLEIDDGEPPSVVLVSTGSEAVLLDRTHQRFRAGRCPTPLAALLPDLLGTLTPQDLVRLLAGGGTLACEGTAATGAPAEVRWDATLGAEVVARCGRRLGVRDGPAGREIVFFEDGAHAPPYRATYRDLTTVVLVGAPWRVPHLVRVEGLAGPPATDLMEMAVTARSLDAPIAPERLAPPAGPPDYTVETWNCARP